MSAPHASLRRHTMVAAALMAALGLAACNKQDDRTASQKLDSAITQGQEAAREAGQEIKQAGQNAAADIRESTAEMRADASAALSKAEEAVSDVSITAAVSAGLAKDPDLSALKINVDTRDGVVSLNGPAPSAAAKARAESIAQAVKGVKSVHNNLSAPG
ncbi:BON domain-containing protein [Ottowia sp.]|jgi:osmotically-inducible protein OsmY|uniref:BON domain-containing protein n=1 Tax=Ottowia sp. TaxID=1898956 RepID=UPI0025EFA041|nr:BON domain-containing protein [Ottowia sp.]MBK6613947.1 BON domain-containing protein [Ottowia sp.]MBK6745492.1 BON domain-containing protein [Ottowia sp.]